MRWSYKLQILHLASWFANAWSSHFFFARDAHFATKLPISLPHSGNSLKHFIQHFHPLVCFFLCLLCSLPIVALLVKLAANPPAPGSL